MPIYAMERMAHVLNMIGGVLTLRVNANRSPVLAPVEKALLVEAVRELLNFFGLSPDDLKPAA